MTATRLPKINRFYLYLVLAIGLALSLLWASSTSLAEAGSESVTVLQFKGIINPVVASYIDRGITAAEQDGAQAVIISMDTPGGLDTSMREIMQRIISSKVPVVVYVSPEGGRAASAGLFVTMAAHIAAMAPNTNIGAAHPVALGIGGQTMDKTMEEKVTNDAVATIKTTAEARGRNADWAEKAVRESVSATEREALDLRVIDLIARDLQDLLKKIDGKEVTLTTGKVILHTADATVNTLPMNPFERVLHLITDPTIAYILLLVGIYGLIYELASPGSIFPGVVGVIALVLAFLALGTLPINFAGLALIIFAFALFVLEAFVSSHGILGVGGAISLLLGSLMLMNTNAPYLRIAPWAIGGAVIVSVSFFLFVVGAVLRSRKWKVKTGSEGLVGAIGYARTALNPAGWVFVQGERWEAIAEEGRIREGDPVRVTSVEGLKLTVRREEPMVLPAPKGLLGSGEGKMLKSPSRRRRKKAKAEPPASQA